MNKGIEVRAIRSWPQNCISLFIEQFGPGQVVYRAEPIVMQKMELDDARMYLTDDDPRFAPININQHSAQQLMDDLWQCGLRPSEGTGSAGQLASVQKHLADMRQIAFGKLKIEKP